MDLSKFQSTVWDYYEDNARDLPWRHTQDPYEILVSEMMLQQTQVSRVIAKYEQFLKEFPSVQALAIAPFSLVLEQWSGLGYNRRAKYLHEAAKNLSNIPQPWTIADLRLKGIGSNTAAAVCVYAYNEPHVFIETNIRSVFLYHFCRGQQSVADKQLLPLIEQTMDRKNPRGWCWALMDYGSYLKQTHPNPSRASKHHTTQSRFVGSQRQIRGQVLRELLTQPSLTFASLRQKISDQRLENVLTELTSEGLIVRRGQTFNLAD